MGVVALFSNSRLRVRAASAFLVACALAVMTSACAQARAPAPAKIDSLERIPTDWIDLPESPFVARMTARGEAVLFNRSTASFDRVSTGCVINDAGRVHTAGQLFAVQIYDSEYRPQSHVTGLLRMVNNLDWYIATQRDLVGRDILKRCPPQSRTAVIRAGLRDVHEWSADETKWAQ